MLTEPVDLTYADVNLLVAFAAETLDRSPKENWVEKAGGLPQYIVHIAKDIHEQGGKTISQAIAIAISRVKVWAVKSTNPKTKEKAAAAVVEWEKLKAKNKAKQLVKATRADGAEYLLGLSATDFSIDAVRRAFEDRERDLRAAFRMTLKAKGVAPYDYDSYPYRYVREAWSTFLIVEGDGGTLSKVPFEVADDGSVTFGEEVPVQIAYREVPEPAVSSAEAASLSAAGVSSGLQDLVAASRTLSGPAGPLLKLSAGPDAVYADGTGARYPIDTPEHVRLSWAALKRPGAVVALSQDGISVANVRDRVQHAAKLLAVPLEI